VATRSIPHGEFDDWPISLGERIFLDMHKERRRVPAALMNNFAIADLDRPAIRRAAGKEISSMPSCSPASSRLARSPVNGRITRATSILDYIFPGNWPCPILAADDLAEVDVTHDGLGAARAMPRASRGIHEEAAHDLSRGFSRGHAADNIVNPRQAAAARKQANVGS